MENYLRGELEVEGGGIGPSLGGDLLPHVGASIRSGGSALCGQHGGKMAGFVEEITGVEQTLGVNDEPTWLQCDAGQEGVGAKGREANGQADLLEPVENNVCRRIKHRPGVERLMKVGNYKGSRSYLKAVRTLLDPLQASSVSDRFPATR
jgi:hypothetical protein